MKLIIAGGRDLLTDAQSDWKFIREACHLFNINTNNIDEVVNGKCPYGGVDAAGEYFADILGLDVKPFPADFDRIGRAAGPKRNKQMAEYADALLLIWDGKSRGSANMKSQMLKLKKPIYEIILQRYGQQDDI